MVEYAGTAYAGFQRQPHEETVQGVLERAIQQITGEEVNLTAAGRTDAGAHAVYQVISFTSGTSLAAESLTRALNAHLPPDIAVTCTREVPDAFHPRFDACSRTYRYLIWNREQRSPLWLNRAAYVRRPLEADRMDAASRHLLGEHDFSAFTWNQERENRTRRMQDARCWREGHLVIVELRASGFLKQMVRSIAGTLIEVGKGRLEPDALPSILASRDRERAGETAPACGLYLVNVEYPAHAVEI